MNDMIDRYVHQVGLWVRPKERAEIEAELRSQIQDQLEDRYGASPTAAQVASVLQQLGDPRALAASYGGEQYLVGPDLYPFMMTVLRFGLPLVPAVVVIANVIGALLSPAGADWVGLLIGSVFTAVQGAILFFAVVVIIFAIVQHSGTSPRNEAKTSDFNPLELPPVNDPRTVDRFESGVDIAVSTLLIIAFAYFVQVGGLTLRFNPSNPGDVLPVPIGWLIVQIIVNVSDVVLNLWALIRRRWTLWMWLAETVLKVVGAVSLYFVLLKPLAERLTETAPDLAAWLPLDQLPVWITVAFVALLVLISGSKLIRLWQYRQGANS